MAIKKTSSKGPVSKAEPSAGRAKPAVKSVVAKEAAVESIAPRSAAVSISPKPAATRAAEVEVNIGGSRPLSEFLNEIDWFE